MVSNKFQTTLPFIKEKLTKETNELLRQQKEKDELVEYSNKIRKREKIY